MSRSVKLRIAAIRRKRPNVALVACMHKPLAAIDRVARHRRQFVLPNPSVLPPIAATVSIAAD